MFFGCESSPISRNVVSQLVSQSANAIKLSVRPSKARWDPVRPNKALWDPLRPSKSQYGPVRNSKVRQNKPHRQAFKAGSSLNIKYFWLRKQPNKS